MRAPPEVVRVSIADISKLGWRIAGSYQVSVIDGECIEPLAGVRQPQRARLEGGRLAACRQALRLVGLNPHHYAMQFAQGSVEAGNIDARFVRVVV